MCGRVPQVPPLPSERHQLKKSAAHLLPPRDRRQSLPLPHLWPFSTDVLELWQGFDPRTSTPRGMAQPTEPQSLTDTTAFITFTSILTMSKIKHRFEPVIPDTNAITHYPPHDGGTVTAPVYRTFVLSLEPKATFWRTATFTASFLNSELQVKVPDQHTPTRPNP